ncbi:MAG: HAMP domain-containing protein, partial [Mangrovicoccus sp.]
TGAVIGVMAFQLPVDRMQATIADRSGLTATTEMMVVGDDLTNRSDTILGGTKPLLSKIETLNAIDQALAGKTGSEATSLANGIDYEVSYQPIDFLGANWAMLAAEPMSAIMAGPRDLMVKQAILTCVVLMGAVVVCFFAARSLSRPLHQIEGSMRKVAEKDYDSTVPHTTRKDEIGAIARTLEEFRASLAEFDAAARESIYKSAAFAGTSAAMMITDRDFKITHANDAVKAVLHDHADTFRKKVPNFDPDKVLGQNMDSFHKDPSHARRLLSDPKNLPYSADISIGANRFSLYVSAVRDENGHHFGNVVEWKDVSKERLNASILNAIDTYQSMMQILPDGGIESLNNESRKILGDGADGLIGKNLESIFQFDPELDKKFGKVWDRLQAGKSVYGKFNIRLCSGEEGWLEGGFSPVMDKHIQLVRVTFIGSDRTEAEISLRKAEEIRQQMEKAQSLVVDQLQIALDRMAMGDLTANIDVAFNQEYEQLREDFNKSMLSLLNAMQGVSGAAGTINSSATNISGASDDLSRRTERQAATLEETAAALDQLTASVSQAASGATEADRIVKEARERAQTSGKIVDETVQAMGQIETSSEQISKIISVIDDIAFQTNLLAL